MSLTRKQYAAEKKKIAKDRRETRKLEKQMQAAMDELAGLGAKAFRKNVIEYLVALFTMSFKSRINFRMVEVEIGKTVGDFERMFEATKEAITDLQEKVEALRCLAVCESLEAYSRRHTGNMPEEEKVELLKTFGFDPEELKRAYEQKQKATKSVSVALNA